MAIINCTGADIRYIPSGDPRDEGILYPRDPARTLRVEYQPTGRVIEEDGVRIIERRARLVGTIPPWDPERGETDTIIVPSIALDLLDRPRTIAPDTKYGAIRSQRRHRPLIGVTQFISRAN